MSEQEVNTKPPVEEAPKPVKPSRWMRLRAWMRRNIRPVFLVRTAFRLVLSPFDAEDLVYIFASLLIAFGVWRILGDGYSLISFGVMLVIPPMVSLFRGGHPKGGDK